MYNILTTNTNNMYISISVVRYTYQTMSDSLGLVRIIKHVEQLLANFCDLNIFGIHMNSRHSWRPKCFRVIIRYHSNVTCSLKNVFTDVDNILTSACTYLNQVYACMNMLYNLLYSEMPLIRISISSRISRLAKNNYYIHGYQNIIHWLYTSIKPRKNQS